VRVDENDGKASLTHFRRIATYEGACLVEATLETGRTHQIRVHSQHLGHPIGGDEKYGDRDFNRRMKAFGLKRLFLHAARFEFDLGGRAYAFSAPLAADLVAVLDALPPAPAAPRALREGRSVR
ncbi:MAG TPA: pseudouridine synthase, partial [Rhodanobacteraceae bacterium]|nr:pseudouridine synthase [Rhodanobacteraceae bacterium]